MGSMEHEGDDLADASHGHNVHQFVGNGRDDRDYHGDRVGPSQPLPPLQVQRSSVACLRQ